MWIWNVSNDMPLSMAQFECDLHWSKHELCSAENYDWGLNSWNSSPQSIREISQWFISDVRLSHMFRLFSTLMETSVVHISVPWQSNKPVVTLFGSKSWCANSLVSLSFFIFYSIFFILFIFLFCLFIEVCSLLLSFFCYRFEIHMNRKKCSPLHMPC